MVNKRSIVHIADQWRWSSVDNKEGDLVITVYTIFHVRPILEKYESGINMTFCLKYGFEYLKCNLGQGGSLIDYKEYHTLNEDLAVQKTKELMDQYNENLP